MPHVGVWIQPEMKERLLRRARASGQSVTVEVTTALLRQYKPQGWKVQESNIVVSSRPRRGRPASVINDGAPEALTLYISDSLRARLQEEAGKNFRSVSAEVRMFLDKEFKK